MMRCLEIVIGVACLLAVPFSSGNNPVSAEPLKKPSEDQKDDSIRPWSKNPRYWQYRGQPVLLLGGSDTDHIFLLDGLRQHLDEIAEGRPQHRRRRAVRMPDESRHRRRGAAAFRTAAV